jgi:hypothetical protein
LDFKYAACRYFNDDSTRAVLAWANRDSPDDCVALFRGRDAYELHRDEFGHFPASAVALFRHFPIRRGADLQLHWRVLTVYFGLNAAATMAMIAFPGQMWVNTFLLVGLIVCYSIWMMKLSAEGEWTQTPASDDEKRQWERSQARASLVLGRITVRGLLGLVLHPGENQT